MYTTAADNFSEDELMERRLEEGPKTPVEDDDEDEDIEDDDLEDDDLEDDDFDIEEDEEDEDLD